MSSTPTRHSRVNIHALLCVCHVGRQLADRLTLHPDLSGRAAENACQLLDQRKAQQLKKQQDDLHPSGGSTALIATSEGQHYR